MRVYPIANLQDFYPNIYKEERVCSYHLWRKCCACCKATRYCWLWQGNDINAVLLITYFKHALKIRGRSGQSWPDLCPWCQLLPPLPTHLYFISPKSTLYIILCSQLEHQICPPHPHNICFRGFTENNTHRRDGCLLKSNEFFGKRDSHPSLPKCNKPHW